MSFWFHRRIELVGRSKLRGMESRVLPESFPLVHLEDSKQSPVTLWRAVTGLCEIPVTGNGFDNENLNGLFVSVYLNKVRILIKNTLSEGEVTVFRFELAHFDKFFFCRGI